jgi:hypothetical protein
MLHVFIPVFFIPARYWLRIGSDCVNDVNQSLIVGGSILKPEARLKGIRNRTQSRPAVKPLALPGPGAQSFARGRE